MSDFSAKILDASRAAVRTVFGIDPDDRQLMVETPKDPKMGDYSTSVAMRLAKVLHKSPMEIAAPIVEELKKTLPEARSIEAVKPGFINFRIAEASLSDCINKVIEAGDQYGHNEMPPADCYNYADDQYAGYLR